IAIAGLGLGCSKDNGPDTSTTRVVPRPDAGGDGAPMNAILDDCESGEGCTGAASCQANCGVHELGDSACMCGANGQLTCTACVLNAEFRPLIKDATALCDPLNTNDGRMCTTKGDTCIAVSYNSMGVASRRGCLCWQGRTRLEWDCSGNLEGFFQDMAPASPPPPPPPVRDGGTDAPMTPSTPPVTPPTSADAATAG
ncbi:MAG TPA: hypothetical protein VGG33_12430, partial [Polyangia bacterium]